MIKGADNISEQIYFLSILQKNYIHEELKKIDINEMQARTINYISTYSGTIQKKLAEYLGKQNATITNILKTLEKKGYIKREIPEGNEREKRLYITDEGKEVVVAIQDIFSRLESIMMDSLNDIEINNLKNELKKISENFK